MKKNYLLVFLLSFCSLLFSQTQKKLADGLYATIETSQGNMLIELYYTEAPVTVANFVGLAEGKIKTKVKKGPFYKDVVFHRVIKNFMIQTGDPSGTGEGGPGYAFADEFSTALRHDKIGILSMANAGPFTNGSQFFITEKATPWLDGKHSVFGQVIEGLEVLQAIASVKTDAANKPLEPVTILTITITRKGTEAKKFKAIKVFDNRDDQAMKAQADKTRVEMKQTRQDYYNNLHEKTTVEKASEPILKVE